MKCTIILIVAVALLCVKPLVAEENKEIKGYNGLYMGHSFFWPSEEKLENIIPDSTVVGHKQYLVRSGGAGGSPGNLWANKKKRDAGQRHLDTKKIDLLVMTYHSPENSSAEHYSKWFDYAIARNPGTTFMVTIAWAGHLYKADKERLDYLKTVGQRFHDTLIVELREKYPENKILFCPYGLGAYELIDQFNEGKLQGVKYLLNMDRKTRGESRAKKEQLLNDELGHPGELVATLGALLWLQTLYDYDLPSLKSGRIDNLPDIDLKEIATTVSQKIELFNAAYKRK
jgi:hypothetical protein